MSNARIDATQSVEEGAVLPEWHHRDTASAAMGCERHSNARA
jgi:hypothetical protein